MLVTVGMPAIADVDQDTALAGGGRRGKVHRIAEGHVVIRWDPDPARGGGHALQAIPERRVVVRPFRTEGRSGTLAVVLPA